MPHSLTAVLFALLAAPLAGAAPSDCAKFLTGDWAGKGDVEGFGTPVPVENAYSYKADRTFVTRNRFLGTDKRWNEQTVSGTWSAKAGRARAECVLTMKSSAQGFSSSSTSDFQMIDRNTFRSMGFDMKRVRK